jgi:hypothetical protein
MPAQPPAFRFLVPYQEFNRILKSEEASTPSDEAFGEVAKALAEWKRRLPLVRSYYLGSSPFLPLPSLQTRSPRQALESFVSFICLAEDDRLEWMALVYLLKACRAFALDYEDFYFPSRKHPDGSQSKVGYRRNPLSRKDSVRHLLDLVMMQVLALNFLKVWEKKEPLGQEGMEAAWRQRSHDFAQRFLKATSRELEQLDRLCQENLGRHKDPETELIPLWKSWFENRVLKRFEALEEGRKAKWEGMQPRWKQRRDEREQRKKAEEERQRLDRERREKERQENEEREERERETRTRRPTQGRKVGLPASNPWLTPKALRTLHRKVLKLCHPDLGATAEDRERRHLWTVRANLAKEKRDVRSLLRLLKELQETKQSPN